MIRNITRGITLCIVMMMFSVIRISAHEHDANIMGPDLSVLKNMKTLVIQFKSQDEVLEGDVLRIQLTDGINSTPLNKESFYRYQYDNIDIFLNEQTSQSRDTSLDIEFSDSIEVINVKIIIDEKTRTVSIVYFIRNKTKIDAHHQNIDLTNLIQVMDVEIPIQQKFCTDSDVITGKLVSDSGHSYDVEYTENKPLLIRDVVISESGKLNAFYLELESRFVNRKDPISLIYKDKGIAMYDKGDYPILCKNVDMYRDLAVSSDEEIHDLQKNISRDTKSLDLGHITAQSKSVRGSLLSAEKRGVVFKNTHLYSEDGTIPTYQFGMTEFLTNGVASITSTLDRETILENRFRYGGINKLKPMNRSLRNLEGNAQTNFLQKKGYMMPTLREESYNLVSDDPKILDLIYMLRQDDVVIQGVIDRSRKRVRFNHVNVQDKQKEIYIYSADQKPKYRVDLKDDTLFIIDMSKEPTKPLQLKIAQNELVSGHTMVFQVSPEMRRDDSFNEQHRIVQGTRSISLFPYHGISHFAGAYDYTFDIHDEQNKGVNDGYTLTVIGNSLLIKKKIQDINGDEVKHIPRTEDKLYKVIYDGNHKNLELIINYDNAKYQGTYNPAIKYVHFPAIPTSFSGNPMVADENAYEITKIEDHNNEVTLTIQDKVPTLSTMINLHYKYDIDSNKITRLRFDLNGITRIIDIIGCPKSIDIYPYFGTLLDINKLSVTSMTDGVTVTYDQKGITVVDRELEGMINNIQGAVIEPENQSSKILGVSPNDANIALARISDINGTEIKAKNTISMLNRHGLNDSKITNSSIDGMPLRKQLITIPEISSLDGFEIPSSPVEMCDDRCLKELYNMILWTSKKGTPELVNTPSPHLEDSFSPLSPSPEGIIAETIKDNHLPKTPWGVLLDGDIISENVCIENCMIKHIQPHGVDGFPIANLIVDGDYLDGFVIASSDNTSCDQNCYEQISQGLEEFLQTLSDPIIIEPEYRTSHVEPRDENIELMRLHLIRGNLIGTEIKEKTIRRNTIIDNNDVINEKATTTKLTNIDIAEMTHVIGAVIPWLNLRSERLNENFLINFDFAQEDENLPIDTYVFTPEDLNFIAHPVQQQVYIGADGLKPTVSNRETTIDLIELNQDKADNTKKSNKKAEKSIDIVMIPDKNGLPQTGKQDDTKLRVYLIVIGTLIIVLDRLKKAKLIKSKDL